MKITYHGYSCFSFKTKQGTVITDPYPESLGIKLPELSADIITTSHNHDNHCYTKEIQGDPLICNMPGEFERKSIFIKGIHAFHNKKEEEDLGENIIFVFHVDGKSICHLGDLGCKLTPEQLEQTGDVDILLVPVGGGNSLDAKRSVMIIDQIEPRIVIPMHYAIPGVKKELNNVNTFLEEMGKKDIEIIANLDISKGSLPSDKTEIHVLEAFHK